MRRPPTPNDSLISPEVAADGRVTFRLYAPKAARGGGHRRGPPGFGQPLPLTRDERGVWSAVTSPLPAGAYRYTFVVDGVSTLDPKNLATSASQTALSSLVVVSPSGDDFQADRADVPHGAVAQVLLPLADAGRAAHARVHAAAATTREATFPCST